MKSTESFVLSFPGSKLNKKPHISKNWAFKYSPLSEQEEHYKTQPVSLFLLQLLGLRLSFIASVAAAAVIFLLQLYVLCIRYTIKLCKCDEEKRWKNKA